MVSGCHSQILVNEPVGLQNHMRYITNLQVPGPSPRNADGAALSKAWGPLCASVGSPPGSGVQLHSPFGLAVPSALREHLKPHGYVTFCLVYSDTKYILWSSLEARSLALAQNKPLVGSPSLLSYSSLRVYRTCPITGISRVLAKGAQLWGLLEVVLYIQFL